MIDVEDPNDFVPHAITAHGMTTETWFNIPTSRGYHDYLHRTKPQDHTHPHQEQP